jgi:hypothetical protein
MKWFLILCGVIVFSLSLSYTSHKSKLYWAAVGPNMDKTMNPNTHKQGED